MARVQSFCSIFHKLSENHTLENSPWGDRSYWWLKDYMLVKNTAGLVGPALRGRGVQDKFFNRLKHGRERSRSPPVVC